MGKYEDKYIKRLYSRFEIVNDCWLWSGCLNAQGYGVISVNGKVLRAHRMMYECSIGAIPLNKELDHLCRNPSCINPAHLEPVTHKENVNRGTASIVRTLKKLERLYCKNKHLMFGRNLRITPQGYYRCKTCHRISERVRRAELSENI